jgi:hypothetical protein
MVRPTPCDDVNIHLICPTGQVKFRKIRIHPPVPIFYCAWGCFQPFLPTPHPGEMNWACGQAIQPNATDSGPN